jgi:hypothetical protein
MLSRQITSINKETEKAAKDHRSAVDGYTRRRLITAISTTALASSGGLGTLFGPESHHTVAGVLSLIAALLAAGIAIINPAELAKLHKDASNKAIDLNSEVGVLLDKATDFDLGLSSLIERLPRSRADRFMERRMKSLAERMEETRTMTTQLTQLKRKWAAIQRDSPTVPIWVTDPYLIAVTYQHIRRKILKL